MVLPGRKSGFWAESRPDSNQESLKIGPSAGRPSAGRRADFEAFPIRIRPKSGPQGRFPARKGYCLAWCRCRGGSCSMTWCLCSELSRSIQPSSTTSCHRIAQLLVARVVTLCSRCRHSGQGGYSTGFFKIRFGICSGEVWTRKLLQTPFKNLSRGYPR